MVQSWKGCVGAIPPGVRIPLSPFSSGFLQKAGQKFAIALKTVQVMTLMALKKTLVTACGLLREFNFRQIRTT